MHYSLVTSSTTITARRYSHSTLAALCSTTWSWWPLLWNKEAASIRHFTFQYCPILCCLLWRASSILNTMGSSIERMTRPNQSPRYAHGIHHKISCWTGSCSGSKGIRIITWMPIKYTPPLISLRKCHNFPSISCRGLLCAWFLLSGLSLSIHWLTKLLRQLQSQNNIEIS